MTVFILTHQTCASLSQGPIYIHIITGGHSHCRYPRELYIDRLIKYGVGTSRQVTARIDVRIAT